MTRRPGRLSLLLLPVLFGLLSQVMPGQAQQSGSNRYAFADTTLLRDTLGLDFRALFPTADSLQMTPDTLRAYMVRYRLSIPRLLVMADSLGMPVDSVGPVLLRERFNPLAQGGPGGRRAVTDFRYTSGYNILRSSSTWTNGSDYNLTVGKLFLRNGTNINMDRYNTGGRVSLRQTRQSTTETGWKLSPDFSLGGRANLERFDSRDPGSTNNEGETKNEFQFSTRTRQRPSKGINSEINLFTGLLDLKNVSQIKRGFSGDLNGRIRATSGTWLSNDLFGQMTGNLSQTRRPSSLTELATHDLSSNLRGTLGIYQNAPVGLNLTYAVRRTRVETPTEADTVNRIVTQSDAVDATVRLRRDNDRFLNLTGNLGRSAQLSGVRNDHGAKANGRYALRGWILDANYSDTRTQSRFPRRNRAFGYNETVLGTSADGVLQRQFSPKMTGKLTSSIGLTQYRYVATADSASPPVPRDSYRQGYGSELLYNRSERLNTGLKLDVGLTRSINLPAKSTSSNNDTRSYRGEWRWSYRLFKGLTVAQTNQISADYYFYPFAAARNQLALDYNTITNLAAVITPRLNIDLSHNARQQPRGDYLRLADGHEYFRRADGNENFTLRSRVTYSPSPALSLSLSPEYLASNRTGTSNGVEVPQRSNRRLNFSGQAILNLKLGQKGQLSGNIGRTYYADRTTTYSSGEPKIAPLGQQDYWNGSLQLTWQL